MTAKFRQSQIAHEVCARLHERFPKCFVSIGDRQGRPRPLAIGIHEPIAEVFPELSRRMIHRALAIYTSRFVYVKAVVAGAARIDLDGIEVGVVTVDHAEKKVERAKLAQELSRARVAAERVKKVRQKEEERARAKALRIAARKAERAETMVAATDPAPIIAGTSSPRRPIISLKRSARAA